MVDAQLKLSNRIASHDSSPHQDQITQSTNENTVSGSLQITLIKQSQEEHGSCDFNPASGYSGGLLGEAKPRGGDKEMGSKQDCCDACYREERCAKFTYEVYSHACTMYQAYAENYLTGGLMSGVVNKRSAKAIKMSITSHEEMSWQFAPAPPVPPLIAFRNDEQPPPPASMETDAVSKVISILSLTVGGIMVCAY